MNSPRWLVVLWFALIVTTWTIRGLPWNLDEFDQAKQAYTSYEMAGRNAWWYQHTPRQGTATKPPFVGWISAGVHAVTGSWDVAWRLPSLLAAIALLGLLWRSGQLLSGNPGAWLATAAFSWNLLTLRLATLVRTDMVLAALIFTAGWLIWRRLQTKSDWTSIDTALLTLVLAAATMTKGPIYHAFLLPGLIVWLVASEPDPNKRRIAIGYLIAAVLSVLPFLLWTWLRMQHDPAFYDQVVKKEFLGRFTTGAEAVHNNQTWYFYLPHLLGKCAPWSLLFLAGMFAQSRVRRDSPAPFLHRGNRLQLRWKPSAATLWLVCWCLGGVIAMSLVPSKRVDRIFPVIPVAALCLPALLPLTWQRSRSLLAVGAATVIGYASYTGFVVNQGYREHADRLVVFGREAAALCQKNQWSYSVVEGRDEGLLMYADQMEFINAKTASRNLGHSLDAVIIDSISLARLRKKTSDFESILHVESEPGYSYELIRRRSP